MWSEQQLPTAMTVHTCCRMCGEDVGLSRLYRCSHCSEWFCLDCLAAHIASLKAGQLSSLVSTELQQSVGCDWDTGKKHLCNNKLKVSSDTKNKALSDSWKSGCTDIMAASGEQVDSCNSCLTSKHSPLETMCYSCQMAVNSESKKTSNCQLETSGFRQVISSDHKDLPSDCTLTSNLLQDTSKSQCETKAEDPQKNSIAIENYDIQNSLKSMEISSFGQRVIVEPDVLEKSCTLKEFPYVDTTLYKSDNPAHSDHNNMCGNYQAGPQSSGSRLQIRAWTTAVCVALISVWTVHLSMNLVSTSLYVVDN